MGEYLKNLKQRDIAIAIIVLMVLVAVAWWFLFYQSTREEIAAVKEDIVSLDAQIEEGKRAKENLPLLKQEVQKLRDDKAVFLQELPRSNDVANLLIQLTDSATDAKVILQNIDSSGANGDDIQDVRQLDFSTGTTGVYEATLDFLRALESLSNGRFTKINSVDFSVGDAEGEDLPEGAERRNPPLEATYDFSVFVYTGESVE